MIPASFSYDALPARVRFGSGTIELVGEEAARLRLNRVLVLSTPEQERQAEQVAGLLGDRSSGIFHDAAMHTPVDVTHRALTRISDLAADGVLSVGGGSAIGLGKAIALRTGLPQIVLPTTYAGSEATPILGQTDGGVKTTQRTLDVLPEVIIYDVDLSLTLPVPISMTSGLNAIAHAAEALYAPDANPMVEMMAERGIAALVAALPRIHDRGDDREGRTLALFGAWLCGCCLGAVGMGLHHKICHTLGGAFNLPHAPTHGIMLPHTLAYNLPAAPAARDRMSTILGNSDPALALAQLARRIDAPTALNAIGMPESGIEDAADLAVRSPYPNPHPIERGAIAAMLRRAWEGALPEPLAMLRPETRDA